ncbi:MAG TPA: RnfH family protein [Gammaproteobacteria bacterium]|nr:RnfH family protein [Gammaproteobacteria bacterium]
MSTFKEITVEVAYATREIQRILVIKVTEGSTIETAIERSGVLDIFPEIDLMKQSVGIFGRKKKLSDTVSEGDRVEIYRPLEIDPKEARRLRAGR